jgi:hypothetical protein
VKRGLAALPSSGATLAAGLPWASDPGGRALRPGRHARHRGPLAEFANFNKLVVENGLQER